MRDSLGPFLRRGSIQLRHALAKGNARSHRRATRRRIPAGRDVASTDSRPVRKRSPRSRSLLSPVGLAVPPTMRRLLLTEMKRPGEIHGITISARHSVRCACGRKVDARNGNWCAARPSVALLGANSFRRYRRCQMLHDVSRHCLFAIDRLSLLFLERNDSRYRPDIVFLSR